MAAQKKSGALSQPGKDRVRSLEKGLQLLILLSKMETGANLNELARRAGFAKTSCHRLLQTLKSLGFVEQSPLTKRYMLGNRNISIGAAALKASSLRQTALPLMRELQAQTGETVNLSVLDGSEIVFIERLEARHIISTHHQVGDRLRVHHTCMGKAILAFLSEAKVDQILSGIDFTKATEQSIGSPDALKAELQDIRRLGLATNNQELEKGLCAVAAPIRDVNGDPIAALNVAFPLMRHDLQEASQSFGPMVKRASRTISEIMGFRAHDD